LWPARRKGKGNWCGASIAREAIRTAMLLPPGSPPAWLREVASDASEWQIIAATGAEAREDRASDVIVAEGSGFSPAQECVNAEESDQTYLGLRT